MSRDCFTSVTAAEVPITPFRIERHCLVTKLYATTPSTVEPIGLGTKKPVDVLQSLPMTWEKEP